MIQEWLGVVRPYFEQYGYAFVFAALFLENVLFLGVVIPGAVVLLICAWLSQKGTGFPFPLVLVGFCGTIAGDMVSYLMGKTIGHRLLESRKVGKGLTALRTRVQNEPALPLFCHFISYLRMFVPAASGLSGIPFARWLALDATGAAFWVTSQVVIGYSLSISSASAFGERLATIVIGIMVVVIAVHYLMGRRKKVAEKRNSLSA